MRLRLAPLVIIATFALTLSVAAQGCIIPANAGALQAEVVRAVNAERAARGLGALRLSASLDKAAQNHACDNASRLSISHVSSDGSQLQQRLRRAGYAYRLASENTGRGFGSGTRAVQWWMNSSKHKHNILMSQVREIGVGIAMSPAPDSKLHWIINMGKSR